MRNRVVGTNSVYSLVDGFLTKIGNTFGFSHNNPDDEMTYENCVVQWQSGVYAMASEDGIYKLSAASGNSWGKIVSLLSPGLGANAGALGLYPLVRGGQHVLATVYATTTNDIIRPLIIKPDDTNVFLSTIDTNIDHSLLGFKTPLVFNNRLYWQSITNGGVVHILNLNPETDAITLSNDISANHHRQACGSLVTQSGNLYLIGHNTAGTAFRVSAVEGPMVNSLGTFGATANPGLNHKPIAFTEDGHIYYFGVGATSTAVGVWRVTFNTDGTIAGGTNIASTVLPFTTSAASTADKWWVVTDTESIPGDTTRILAYAANATSSGVEVSFYRWNGPDTRVTFLGAAADPFLFSLPQDQYGGGHRTMLVTGELSWTYVSSAVVGDMINVNYHLNGPQDTTGVAVGLRYALDGDPLERLATLSATSHGSLSGNYVVGLTVKNADVLYTMTWEAAQDGLVSDSMPLAVGEVFYTS
jgi:hypothetical protein